MIQVSETFKQLMKSNIRPKCEPNIKVYGEDENGNVIYLEWKASNIKSMKYRRGVDLIGRTLPYMELEWEEVYSGRLDENSFPEKYKNIVKYMAVELSFVQDLGKHGLWKYFNPDINPVTWQEMFAQNVTWRSLFAGRYLNNDFSTRQTEVIKVPTMFLDARPVFSGNTIKWTAKDVLFFLKNEQNKIFLPPASSSNRITDVKIIGNLIADNRASYMGNKKLFTAMTNTIDAINRSGSFAIEENMACNGVTADLTRNVAAVFNRYWDFLLDFATLKNAAEDIKKFAGTQPVYSYSSKVLYKYPEITKGTAVSEYNFKKNYIGLLAEQTDPYIIDVADSYVYDGVAFDVYNFKGYGESISAGIFATDGIKAIQYQGKGAFVVPYDSVSTDYSIITSAIGEPFIEDNPQCVTENQVERAKLVKQYFSNKATIEFSALPNVALQPCDVISVETNTFNDNKRIHRKAVIVAFDLEYNGALKQKIIAHEVE